MDKDIFFCTSYQGFFSNEWNVGNGVCQAGVTSGVLLKFYLNEVLTDKANLPLGCELSNNRVSIFCNADDIA